MTETTAQLRLKLKQAKTEAARDRAERLDLMSKLDDADRQIDFWQADSATAWDKCEERRVAQIAAESRAERLEAALRTVSKTYPADEWRLLHSDRQILNIISAALEGAKP